ncbi:MAG: Cna B-type domain-containing protein, partial [Clostridia bacterium]|nr:Cna B-type domain-containing protein [Clostridia bacterium]
MKKIARRVISIVLAVFICMNCLPTYLFVKAETLDSVWYGDQVAIDITAGEDGYTFMSLFQKPVHGYEFGGHMMGSEGPQTFVMIDTVEYDNTTWTPNGKYVSGQSNYEVVYCCDVETMVKTTYYKRLNLEDSEYYDDVQAAKLRAVVTNSYPYVSFEEMKADLAENGYEYAEELKLGEVIAAVQTAIWACANGEVLRYSASYRVSDNFHWGQPLHDISNLSGLDVAGKGKNNFKTYEDVGKRIDSLVDYLLTLESVHADRNSTVVTNLEIVDSTPVIAKDDVYTILLKVELNHSGRAGDDLSLDVAVEGEHVASQTVLPGTNEYTFTVEAKAGETIKAVLSGEQYLNRGVYFYAPKPEDTNGDGIATSREVSQNLVGVAGGKTPVYCEKEVEIPEIDGETASLKLRKVDHNGKPLTGAEFTLYAAGEKGDLKIGTYAVDENGELIIENLLPGNYTLKETKVPFGYITPAEDIKLNIDKNGYITVLEGENAEIVDGESFEVTVEKDSDIKVGEELPEIKVDIIPGETTSAEISEKTGDDKEFIIIVREASASATETVTTETSSHGEMTSIIPSKITANGTELDMSYWVDPDSVSVTGSAPAGFPYQIVGAGQQSNQYISRIYVIYEKDEVTGQPIKDENGNYVIKELRKLTTKANEILTVNGVATKDINAPFDQKTGTTAAQAFLKDEAGNTVCVYCCDLGKDVPEESWFSVNNLEDVDFFASEEAENHIRNIVTNGYWGTESGTGSLELIKEKLIAALKSGEIDEKVDLTYKNSEGKNVTETVILTEDILRGLTNGEALDMTQCAIWSYSNGCLGVQDGRDGYILGSLTYGDSKRGNKISGVDNTEGMARMIAMYNWLVNLDEELTSTTVINEYNFISNIVLEIGNMVKDDENDTYVTDLKFDLDFTPSEKDDLLVHLTYTNAGGDLVEVIRRLSGENTDGRSYDYVSVKDGHYVIEGLELTENTEKKFELRIEGTQNLERGVYIYLAQNGIEDVQTVVGMAEGTRVADVSKSISFTFNVEESKHYEKTYTKVDQTLIIVNDPERVSVSGTKNWVDNNDQDGIRPESIKINLLANGEIVKTITVTAADEWKWTFSGLVKYENGEEIEYTVTEDVIEGYETVITGNAAEGFVVTNIHKPEQTEIFGTKVWNDANDQDGLRPESITINLLANGKVIKTVTVSEADGWTWSFTDLPKFEGGIKIEYTVTEEAVEGYRTSVEGSAENGFIVTNTHLPEKTEVSGNKTWNDANNQDGKRPTSITINLLANGKVIKTITVTEADGWKWSFKDLD